MLTRGLGSQTPIINVAVMRICKDRDLIDTEAFAGSVDRAHNGSVFASVRVGMPRPHEEGDARAPNLRRGTP